MGNLSLKSMEVKKTRSGEWLLLVHLQDDSTKRMVDWAAEWEEFAKVFEATFFVERANLGKRIERLINKVISIDAMPLTHSLKKVWETSKETERKLEELSEIVSPLEEEAESELIRIGVRFPEASKQTELKTIQEKWVEFAHSLQGEGPEGTLDAFLRSACEPVAIEADTLVLGFYYSFHKEKIEDPKYRYLVERKLEAIFGKPYRLRCILVDHKERGSQT